MPKGVPVAGRRVSRRAERMAIRPAIVDKHQLYELPEAAAARGRSVASLHNDIRAQRIKVTKVGRRTLILGAEIIAANLRDAGVEVAG